MKWENGEHFQDHTAGEAVCRALCPEGGRGARADDGGCRALCFAVLRQAVEDYRAAERRRAGPRDPERLELEAFFRSGAFRALARAAGGGLVPRLRKEMRRL